MTLETVKTLAEEARDLRATYLAKVNELRAAVRDADRERDGQGRNELARAAEPGLSRRLVYEVLGAADLRARAEKIVGNADQRFRIVQVGAGPVQLTACGQPGGEAPAFEGQDFEDGTVKAAARKVLGRLRRAGVEVPARAAEELAGYGTVKLSS